MDPGPSLNLTSQRVRKHQFQLLFSMQFLQDPLSQSTPYLGEKKILKVGKQFWEIMHWLDSMLPECSSNCKVRKEKKKWISLGPNYTHYYTLTRRTSYGAESVLRSIGRQPRFHRSNPTIIQSERGSYECRNVESWVKYCAVVLLLTLIVYLFVVPGCWTAYPNIRAKAERDACHRPIMMPPIN